MTLDSWLILASIGITILGGIFTALSALQTWLVVQVFALRSRVKVLEKVANWRLRRPDDDSLENSA